MKYFILIFVFIFFISLSFIYFLKINMNSHNSISAYYNNTGSFAGFIQKKNGLIRACEFSTNGTILSCSKWFNEKLLKQGQNEGLNMEDIRHNLFF